MGIIVLLSALMQVARSQSIIQRKPMDLFHVNASCIHCTKGLGFQLVHCLANVCVQASFQDL